MARRQTQYINQGKWHRKKVKVPLSKVYYHPDYDRSRLQDVKKQERLIDRHGLKPVKVAPDPEHDGRYRVIEGHRRLEAYRHLHGKNDDEIPVVVKDMPKDRYESLFDKGTGWLRRFLDRWF